MFPEIMIFIKLLITKMCNCVRVVRGDLGVDSNVVILMYRNVLTGTIW